LNGSVFNIQRFSTKDGPGIRSVVFFKGCPLSCDWCHNPESRLIDPEIFFDFSKCINCRICENVCPENCHLFIKGEHIFLRENCIGCLKCAEVCPTKALESCGKTYKTKEIIDEVLRDIEFYDESGGGVTLSGGEPLMQYDFALEILKELKKSKVHTAIETSGYCLRDLTDIAQYTDLWLFDIKLISENEHKKYTGVSNDVILQNLHKLDELGDEIILRCPVIPDVNLTKEHFDGILNILNSLKNVTAVQFEPYHPLGITKSERLGKVQGYDNKKFLSPEVLTPYIEEIKTKTNVKIEIV